MPTNKYSGLIYLEKALGALRCNKKMRSRMVIWLKKADRITKFPFNYDISGYSIFFNRRLIRIANSFKLKGLVI